MSFKKLGAALLFLLPGACLLLQDAPTSKAGEDCEDHDWCAKGLICLRPNGAGNPGKCGLLGACYVDTDCNPGVLCLNASYDAPGACTVNTGCSTNATCPANNTCFRGRCFLNCTTSSQCPSTQICTTVPCPLGATNCPKGCQTL